MSNQANKPNRLEIAANQLVGYLADKGWMPQYCHLLLVRGRKTGRIFRTPVNLLELDGKLWLVGARGHMQWTRNAEAAGEVTLKRGRHSRRYSVRVTSVDERPRVLKAYLQRWKGQVQRFFEIDAKSAVSDFSRVAANHPVYELRAMS
jgi:deazaflavin-dependent oxidoreductase (nitroreductase family)